MAIGRPKRVATGFAIVALVFLIAAGLPVLKGNPPRTVFLVLGLVWIALGAGAAAKSRASARPPEPDPPRPGGGSGAS